MAESEMGNMLRDWDARQYLDYYYGHKTVPNDEWVMFKFVANGLRDANTQFATGLELGCGPCLHHAAQAVRWVKRLDMADIQDSNLEEIRTWLRGDPGAFDWSIFIGAEHGVIDVEGGSGGTLEQREALMRDRIQLMKCDLREELPIGVATQYPFVSTYYCTEWVVPSTQGWGETMRKVTAQVAPGGWLFMVGVHATDYCMINGRRVPCANIKSTDVERVLVELGFDPATLRVDVTPGLAPEVSGIQGTFMAYAQRRA